MKTQTQSNSAAHTPGPLNVWPEHSSGKWIVSRTNLGTNDEAVAGEFWCREDAETFASASGLLAACIACEEAEAASWGDIDVKFDFIRKAAEQARAAILRAKGVQS